MNDNAPTLAPPPVAVGSPVYSRDRIGHITAIKAAGSGVFSIGGGGLTRAALSYEVTFADSLDSLPDSIVAPWLEAARRMGLPSISEDEAAQHVAAVRLAIADRRAIYRADQDEAERRRVAFRADAAGKIPPGAKAVIYAELHEDDSDTMSDYHGHKVRRVVILGFSPHARDLFPELRKAAAGFADTAHLATAPEKAEHREKYSMGAGYYLKDSYRDSTGWMVRKAKFYGDDPSRWVDAIPVGEWALAPDEAITREATASAPAAAVQAAEGFSVSEHVHSTKGFRMWIATGPRVERDEYDRLLSAAKALGGWYTRPWGTTPGGFAFKDHEKAHQFIGYEPAVSTPFALRQLAPATVERVARGVAKATGMDLGAKLRGLADAMQGEIDSKFAPRQTNTPKRQREADSARLDGNRLQRTQQGLRALAAHHDAGTVPAVLAGVKTKAAAFDLARSEINRDRAGYYDAGIDTGKPGQDTPAAAAFFALLTGPTDAERAAEALRLKVQALQFARIPGYFPTPGPIVARMLEAARIPDGQTVVMEPSAGSGAIMDAVQAAHPAAGIVAYEVNHTLRSILEGKGYQVEGDDFMESDLSRKVPFVLMNPPFENGQDIDHVRRAFEHLDAGGRLVAIMSPGPFYRQDRKATAFREWFDEHGGDRHEIEAGAFKVSGTEIATVLVVLDR